MAKRERKKKTPFLQITSVVPAQPEYRVRVRDSKMGVKVCTDTYGDKRVVIMDGDDELYWLDDCMDADGLAQCLILAAAEVERVKPER